MQVENTRALPGDLLEKQSKKNKTDKEPSALSCLVEWAPSQGEPPMGGCIPGTGSMGIIPGREGLPPGIMGGCRHHTRSRRRLGRGRGSWPLQEEDEQRMELGVSSLVEMQPLFCQSGSGPGNILSHSLCVSYPRSLTD